MDLIKQISEDIHFFVRDNFPDGTILFTQIALKSIFFVLVIFLVDFVIRKIVGWALKFISSKYDNAWVKAILEILYHGFLRISSFRKFSGDILKVMNF